MDDVTEPSAEHGVREVKSAARTIEVLELLASRQNRPARLRELSEALGVPRSSLHALLRTLANRGWVRSDSTGMLYGIGIRALLAGTSYLDSDPTMPLVLPYLDELREKLDETFHLGRLDGTDIVYLATRESSQYLRPYSRVGRRLPAYTTSLGKALLAQLEDDELGAHVPSPLLPLTTHTITDLGALREDLQLTRRRGYAVDNEENSLGLRCFAVPLPYATPVTDAISVSIPVARLDEEREEAVVAALTEVGARVVRTVGPVHQARQWD